MLTILNLHKFYRDKFKIVKEPSWYIPKQKDSDKEWTFCIPCRKGGMNAHIYTNNYKGTPNALAFYGIGPRNLQKKILETVKSAVLHFCGDAEYVITFSEEDLDQVADLVKAIRKYKSNFPKITPEQKRKNRERFMGL